MITLIVYFHGPMTAWSRVPAVPEIVARCDCRWLWLARMQARSIVSQLNTGRCGYVLSRDGEVLERVEAPAQVLQ